MGSLGVAGLLGLATPREQKAQEQVARATRAMPIPKIKDVSVIECQPAGVRLTPSQLFGFQPSAGLIPGQL